MPGPQQSKIFQQTHMQIQNVNKETQISFFISDVSLNKDHHYTSPKIILKKTRAKRQISAKLQIPSFNMTK